MQKNLFSATLCVAIALGALSLGACDPKFNWREVKGKNPPFTVLLPAKPASMTRPINLNGQKVDMTMTAAEVDGVSFAVGAVQFADPVQAHDAVRLMQTAMIKNINGTAKPLGGSNDGGDIEASGAPAAGGPKFLLIGHFAAVGNGAYQVIVLGPEKEVSREQAATFLTSFNPN
ncbi:MAG TPA: hypothetical protein VIF60_10000 [Burkholderiaceae bacterium]|jgi:hypothetical protein